jgi:hypothetical protein
MVTYISQEIVFYPEGAEALLKGLPARLFRSGFIKKGG